MSVLDLNALNALPKVERILALAETNAQLEKLDAEGRVAWALENLPGDYVLSSSFGIQAAVSLHLVNQIRPDIPVILTDTGYLFPETYQFIDELTDKLSLNLKVYRATESAAWQEARYGKLWEQGVEGTPACAGSSPGAGQRCRCWRYSAACSKCCRSSTGITARCISTCKNTG